MLRCFMLHNPLMEPERRKEKTAVVPLINRRHPARMTDLWSDPEPPEQDRPTVPLWRVSSVLEAPGAAAVDGLFSISMSWLCHRAR